MNKMYREMKRKIKQMMDGVKNGSKLKRVQEIQNKKVRLHNMIRYVEQIVLDEQIKITTYQTQIS